MKASWLRGSALASVLLIASGAVAQTTDVDAQTPPESDARPVQGTDVAEAAIDTEGEDTIVVTGSRIRRAGFDTLEPAVVVSSEYLNTRGLTNVADALNEIPGFGVGVTPEGGQSSFGVGQNFVNRFGLGSARTLTLVNGRRFVSTNAPSLFGQTPGLQVDLNVIPSQLVDRIENIAIGGAPTYGSDAIAGTVNVILKRDFEGLKLTALSGITERGDNHRYTLSGLGGINFGPDDRGNVMVAGSYDYSDGVLSIARQRFADGLSFNTNPLANSASAAIPGRTPQNDGRVNGDIPFNTGSADGIPNAVIIRNTRINSLTIGGVLIPATGAATLANTLPAGFGPGGATRLQFDGSGNLVPFNPGIPFGTQNSSGGDGFFLNSTLPILNDLERLTGNLIARYEVVDDVNLFFEGTYYRANAREIADQSIYNSTLFGGVSAPLRFQATDPRLTPQARARLAQLGVNAFRLNRASIDLVQNNARATTNVYRAVGGIEGSTQVGSRTFDFEATANYGRSESTFRQAVLNQQNFVNAINVTTNAGGQIVCNPTVTAATKVNPDALNPVADPNCAPLNLFGTGQISDAARAYVTATTRARAILEQQVYTLNFGSAAILDLWSGGVGFNLGYEHRNEKGAFRPDDFQRRGLGRAVAIGPNSGEFNTDEFFGELFVPLVSPDNNVPLIHSLSVEGKVRYVDNSVNGGFTTYTAGGRYAPIPDIEFRGNYTRSLRAPSIVELFTPLSPAFNTFPDPCDTVNQNSGPNPAVRQRNCAAFFASYGIDGSTFQSAARTATISIVSGGDPTLANETANSYTFGVVLQPRFLPRFRAAIDWNRIRITGNIASLTPANIAEGCYDNEDFDLDNPDTGNQFCTLFDRVRAPGATNNGQLVNDPANPGLRSVFVNGAFIEFKGLTADVGYNFPLEGIGLVDSSIDISGNLFYIHRYSSSNNQVTINPDQGEIGLPRYNGQLNLGYTQDWFGLDLQANYTSSVKYNLLNTGETQDILKVGDQWLFNGNISFRIKPETILRFTMSNIFDKFAPFPATGIGSYDLLGRRFAVRLDYLF